MFIIGILIYSCSANKDATDKTKYFDVNNVEINRAKFNRLRSSNSFLDIPGDSVNHKKLALREKSGKITNRSEIESLLEKQIDRELDSNKPLVIIYHPGKDPCNSSGTATKKSTRIYFRQLEKGINNIAQTKPIYIFKDKDGLDEKGQVLTWHKDPEGIFERLFFEYHYPCSSFVVISSDGNYRSYFGEFGKKYLWEITYIMNK